MDVVINAERADVPSGTEPLLYHSDSYLNLLACFGYADNHFPLGDWLAQYHQLQGQWLIVSPVYWQATHNDALIMASGAALQCSEQEANLWFLAFSDFVAAEGRILYQHDAYTWLLSSDGTPPLTAKPVYDLHHRSLMLELQQLDPTLFWSRFITESQMFLSNHVLNKKRAATFPINGIWVWGGGALSKPVSTPVIGMTSTSCVLAQRLSTNVSQYDPNVPWSNNSVLWCDRWVSTLLPMLENALRKRRVRWYWNNQAYLKKPKSVLMRWWENITL